MLDSDYFTVLCDGKIYTLCQGIGYDGVQIEMTEEQLINVVAQLMSAVTNVRRNLKDKANA
jgi:hypothetical protein